MLFVEVVILGDLHPPLPQCLETGLSQGGRTWSSWMAVDALIIVITLFSFEQKQQNRKTGWGFPFNYRLGKLILEISILVASVLTKYLQLGRWTLTTCPSIIIIICRIIRKYPNKYCVILKSLKSQVFKLGLTFNIYLLSKIRDKFNFNFDVGLGKEF